MIKELLLQLLSLAFFLFSSFWIKNLFENRAYISIIFIIFSSILLFFLEGVKNKLRYLVLFFPFLFILFNLSLDKTIFNLNDLEIYTINQRRSYYNSNVFAKVFENKLNKYLYNYKKNFFEGLDINYFFFGNHPRERVGIIEIKKFSFVLLPVFLLGVYTKIRRKEYLALCYFISSLALASFFRPVDIFSFIFIPFLATSINTGFWEALSFFRLRLRAK